MQICRRIQNNTTRIKIQISRYRTIEIWRYRHRGETTNNKSTKRPYRTEQKQKTSGNKQCESPTKNYWKNAAEQEGDNIRRKCKVKNVNDWILSRKREWNEHISRMDNEKIVRISWGKTYGKKYRKTTEKMKRQFYH